LERNFYFTLSTLGTPRHMRHLIYVYLVLLLFTPTASSQELSWLSKNILSSIDQKQRLWLHKHLPKMFPISSLCHAFPEGGSRAEAIFPGDTVDFKSSSALIKCGKTVTVWLGPNGKIQVLQTGPIPHFKTLEGGAFFRLAKTTIRLDTENLQYEIIGKRELNFLHWKKTPLGESLTCKSGEISTNGVLLSIKRTYILGTEACKWNFKLDNPEYMSVLWGRESFNLLDTFVSKKIKNLSTVPAEIPIALSMGMRMGGISWIEFERIEKNRIILGNQVVPSKANCELWSSDQTSFSTPELLKKFLMPNGRFQIPLDAPLKPETNLAFFCDDQGAYWVSSQYFPPEPPGDQQ